MNTYDGAWEVFKSVKIKDPSSLQPFESIEGETPCPVCKKGMAKYHIHHPQSIFAGHFSVHCSTENCISFIK